MRQRWSTFSLAAAVFSALLTAAPITVNAQEIVVEMRGYERLCQGKWPPQHS